MIIDTNSGQARLCDGDVNGSGAVDVADLLRVIEQWGACGVCPADMTPRGGDGQVNVAELLLLVGSWGSCV